MYNCISFPIHGQQCYFPLKQSYVPFFCRLIDSLDSLAANVMLDGLPSRTFQRENFVQEITELTVSTIPPAGFESEVSTGLQSLNIPQEAFQSLSGNVRVSVTSHADVGLFPVQEAASTIATNIVSISLIAGSGIVNVSGLQNPVNIDFNLSNSQVHVYVCTYVIM